MSRHKNSAARFGSRLLFLIILVICWMTIYKFENPFKIERAIQALNNGRGYEVLEENNRFLTKEDAPSGLMQFLDGHYGYIYDETYDDMVTFESGAGHVTFKTKPIRFNFVLWEKFE